MSNAVRIDGKVYRANDPSRSLVYPQAGGQYAAFWSEAFEVLGGGSAGGGKSWFLVIDALGLQFAYTEAGKPAYQHQGYRAVLFRRESTQLDRLITEAKLYYPQLGGVFVGGRQGEPGPCFEFPQYGSKIFFCHMQHEDDKEIHQGQEYQYVGFDELTHFLLSQYLYMFSRLRGSAAPLIPRRMRSTTNPTGEGLWWVRKRFVDNTKPGTVNWFLPPEDPKLDPRGLQVKPGTPRAKSRAFIPFWLKENKVLLEADADYASNLSMLGKQMEKALLGGDWYAFGGDHFPGFDRASEVIDSFRIPDHWRLVGSCDPGFSSPCSFGVTAADPKGNYYRIATYYEAGRNPEQHAKAIREWLLALKPTGGRIPEMIVSGRDAFAKNDRYAVIATDKTFAEVFQDYGLFLHPATTDRVAGWWNWKGLMPKRWFVFRDMNDALLDEMSAAVGDEKHPEDLKGCGNDPAVRDHALDECRYGLMAIARSNELPSNQDTRDWVTRMRGVAAANQEESGWYPGRG